MSSGFLDVKWSRIFGRFCEFVDFFISVYIYVAWNIHKLDFDIGKLKIKDYLVYILVVLMSYPRTYFELLKEKIRSRFG